MENVPQRTALASIYRKPLELMEKFLPFGFFNPNYLQIFSLLASIFYLFINNHHLNFYLIVLILLADWLDGAAARARKTISKKGWMIDVVVDRISEGFIFAAHLNTDLGKIFFALYLINIFLSIYSIKSNKHLMLPLRFLWAFYLGIMILWK